ncbi:helix-turn-helix transcriptional regulator [Marinobacterium nitratireducens]|uniref:helix-turn-helix transcriptional regulator n=1 Tax=Marinobacterium nitratireducens TaxID=518897 RepID=UPI00166E4DF3
MADKLLNLKQVEDLIGFKRTWIYEQVRSGTFPSPIRINSRSRWSHRDVQKWITKQKQRNHRTSFWSRNFLRPFNQSRQVKPLF